MCIYIYIYKKKLGRCRSMLSQVPSESEELRELRDMSEAINYRNVKSRRVKLSRDRSDAKDPPRVNAARIRFNLFIFGLRSPALFIIHRYFWELARAGTCFKVCDTSSPGKRPRRGAAFSSNVPSVLLDVVLSS